LAITHIYVLLYQTFRGFVKLKVLHTFVHCGAKKCTLYFFNNFVKPYFILVISGAQMLK